MDECERSYCPNIRTIVTPRTHFLQAVRKGRAVVYGLIQARSDGHWEPGSRCRDSPKLGLGLCCLSKPVGPSLIAWPSLHGPYGSRRVSAIMAWNTILVTRPWGWIPGTISSNSPPPPEGIVGCRSQNNGHLEDQITNQWISRVPPGGLKLVQSLCVNAVLGWGLLAPIRRYLVKFALACMTIKVSKLTARFRRTARPPHQNPWEIR